MLPLSPAYTAHLAGEVTELATCWRITRRDAVVLGFTDHPSDLTIGGLVYQAALGYSATDVATSSDLAVDNLNLQGFIDSPSITEPDLMAGVWDYAEVEIFEVITSDLAAGARPLRRGRIGEVSLGRTVFEAELRGLSQAFTQQLCELTSPTCRAALGDARCKVNLGPLTVTGTITSVTNPRVWTDSTRGEAAGFFSFAKVTWTSGPNAGYAMEIKSHAAGGVMTMQLPMPYAIAVGHGYSIAPGCDKLFSTCRDKFSNVLNFRGEPHIPGNDQMLRGPG